MYGVNYHEFYYNSMSDYHSIMNPSIDQDMQEWVSSTCISSSPLMPRIIYTGWDVKISRDDICRFPLVTSESKTFTGIKPMVSSSKDLDSVCKQIQNYMTKVASNNQYVQGIIIRPQAIGASYEILNNDVCPGYVICSSSLLQSMNGIDFDYNLHDDHNHLHHFKNPDDSAYYCKQLYKYIAQFNNYSTSECEYSTLVDVANSIIEIKRDIKSNNIINFD